MRDTNSWHLMPKEDVLRELGADMFQGLTMEEAKRRRRKLVSGSVWHVKRTSAGEVALATIFDLATLLLLITAAAAALFDKNVEAGAIAGILVLGGVLRALTYLRACRIFEDMAKERIPVTSVIRSGRIRLSRATEIVPGDILFLEAGDTVPCDGRVVTGDDSVVMERGITDNKTPVHKYETVMETGTDGVDIPCEFRTNMLFAGSLVLAGSVRMAATACGNRTLVSMKQGGIEIEPAEKLELIEKLHIRSKSTSLIMLACVMVLTALSIFVGESYTLPDVFLGTMAMAVAAMSEFLTTIGTIILAVTVRDCAAERKEKKEIPHIGKKKEPDSCASSEKAEPFRERAVIRKPSDIERIAEPGIFVFCGSGFFKSGRAELYAYRSHGLYVGPAEAADDEPDETLPDELFRMALAATEGTATGMTAGGASVPRITERAALVLRASNAYTRRSGKGIGERYSLMDHRDASYPLAGGLDVSLILREGTVWAAACGPVEKVLDCCSEEEGKDSPIPLTDERKKEILAQCAELAAGGARLMAVAARPSPYSRLNRLSVLMQSMTFVGFFALSQEPEEDAADNLTALRERGAIPVLFTETPETDLFYGKRLGLFQEETKIIRCADLDADCVRELTAAGLIVSFADIGDAYLAGEYISAIKIIREGAHSSYPEREVAAVGREAWDAGTLAHADWGIAAARSNLRPVPDSLTRHASLVTYPSDSRNEAGFGGLAGIVCAVRGARQAFCNVESAKRFLTLSQCARLTLILAAVLFPVPLISPVFILVWGLLFDFGAVLTMAFEKPDEKGMTPETRRGLVWNLLAGVLWGASLAGLIPLTELAAGAFGLTLTAEQGRSILSAAALCSGLILAAEVCRKESLFDVRRVNPAQILMPTAALFCSAAMLFTSVGARMVGGAVCGLPAAAAMIPALLLLAAAEIEKSVRRKKEQPASESDQS